MTCGKWKIPFSQIWGTTSSFLVAALLNLLCLSSRAHVNEVYNENVRMAEDSSIMQTSLEEMKQELQVARMGAARAEAAAMTAATLTARQSTKPEIAEEEKVIPNWRGDAL